MDHAIRHCDWVRHKPNQDHKESQCVGFLVLMWNISKLGRNGLYKITNSETYRKTPVARYSAELKISFRSADFAGPKVNSRLACVYGPPRSSSSVNLRACPCAVLGNFGDHAKTNTAGFANATASTNFPFNVRRGQDETGEQPASTRRQSSNGACGALMMAGRFVCLRPPWVGAVGFLAWRERKIFSVIAGCWMVPYFSGAGAEVAW